MHLTEDCPDPDAVAIVRLYVTALEKVNRQLFRLRKR